jgi:hypothetical protein
VQREKSADPDIQLICDDSNIFKWTALIKVCYIIFFPFQTRNSQIIQHFNNDKITAVLLCYLSSISIWN